jgi:hypothetical protein
VIPLNTKGLGKGRTRRTRRATAHRLQAPLYVDKSELRRVVDRVNEETDFVPDPDATPEKAQRMMLALGIRPQDNLFSGGIIAAREGMEGGE